MSPPHIVNGRTMVPVRVVAEALGADVDWDEANRAVVVNSFHLAQPTLQGTMQHNYFPARVIVEALTKKYPNVKPASSNLNIEPREGEYRFLITTGELWFNEKKFVLPKQETDGRLRFSIEPLIQEQILILDDIQLS